MSEDNSRPTPDTLDEATGALRDAPVPAGPPADLAAATVAAIHNRLAGAVPAEQVRRHRRRRIMRYTGFATAAAVILGTAGVLWFGGSSASALQKAIEKAKRAESVGYTQRLAVEGIPEQVEVARIRGDQFRIEDGDGSRTRIANLRTRKAVFLDADRKLAQFVELPVGRETPPSLLDSLNKLTGQDGEKVGDEDVAGVRATKFKVKRDEPKGGAEEWFVWVDPKTGWPVKMQSTGKVAITQENGEEKLVPYTLTLDKFEWNAKFEDKLFSLDAPDGYKSVKGIAPPVVEQPDAFPPFALLPRAMAKAAKAETVRFTWTQTSGPPGQKGKIVTTDKNGNVREYDSSSESEMKVIAKGSKVRIEVDGVAGRLEDYATDKVLVLDHKYKVAQQFAAGGKEGDWFGLFDRLAKLKPENVKPAGEEMVGKVKALKFELEKLEKTGVIAGKIWEGAKWTVWIDPKTDLPVRLRYMKDENLKWEFTDFVWNEPAADALFEQKVPDGYKLEESPFEKK